MEENQELRKKLNRINNKIGKTLYLARKDKALGQKEFGNIIGISGNAIKKSEFCPKKLYAAMLFVLCKELDIDVGELANEINKII